MPPANNFREPTYDQLIETEENLHIFSDRLAMNCQKMDIATWPREWMQKVNERAALIKVRQMLLDAAIKLTALPCRELGDGFWDCSKQHQCVSPQCPDCPQKLKEATHAH